MKSSGLKALLQSRTPGPEARSRQSGFPDDTMRLSPMSPNRGFDDLRGMSPCQHRLRIGRVSQTGQVYLVTFCTRERRALFADARVARTAVGALLEPHCWAQASLLTWVLMPDHWHGLVELGSSTSLSALIGRLKGASAHAIGRSYPETRPVWQDGFHDRALRDEDALPDVARYIVWNPIRAGLAASPTAYPYWGSRWREAFVEADMDESR
jgi:putative transposase